MMNFIIAYVIIINIIGLLSMFIDKYRAIKNKWRIPEKTLFLIAILGGSIGSNIGMRLFRHKTKHWYFVFGMPAILIIQLVIISLVLGKYYR
ncbi:MAG: DUF1294 domain-containing protein [Lachnospiraceae bacterium]|jgi:uncharacterized membrane protein YsdA (DUF1294 family)|nr:DUF1294 domain-containing protein [Lachnospiraceae bacterium]MEE0861513.1 DUF1294 domain-containing protein [Lachnospiraceae bacterium]